MPSHAGRVAAPGTSLEKKAGSAYRKCEKGLGVTPNSDTPRPGLEPGSKAPQASRMSTTLPGQARVVLRYIGLDSINTYGSVDVRACRSAATATVLVGAADWLAEVRSQANPGGDGKYGDGAGAVRTEPGDLDLPLHSSRSGRRERWDGAVRYTRFRARRRWRCPRPPLDCSDPFLPCTAK